MTEFYDIFVRNMHMKQTTADSLSCFNAVLFRPSFGVPLVSYGTFTISQMRNVSLHTLPWRENV